ncbi:MAG TPA: phosphotransferase, partial [Kofleriaceae bacterium]
MGVFTALGEAEINELASELALGPVREFRAIAAGTINSNFEIVAETGRYFVRVNEGKAEADVAWEARLVTALATAGVVTPSPMVATSTGLPYAPIGRKWASVFPWRDGHHLAAEAVTTAHAERFGEV